jgi:Spy/CpxP family protein refolding chaperone
MKNGIESLGRVRLQGIALLCVALAVGVLSGMALERVRASRTVRHGGPPFGQLHEGLPPGLAQLHLSTEQEEHIHTIFEARRPVTDSVLRAMLPRLRMAHDSVRAEIRAVLTPEQREQFDRMEGPGPGRGMGPGGRGGPGGPPWDRPPGDGPPPGPAGF